MFSSVPATHVSCFWCRTTFACWAHDRRRWGFADRIRSSRGAAWVSNTLTISTESKLSTHGFRHRDEPFHHAKLNAVLFDWHDPSMTVDTACSSSLIAVHHALQAPRAGESQVTVACRPQGILRPRVLVYESKLNMVSPTGRSRMWDADAGGYARQGQVWRLS